MMLIFLAAAFQGFSQDKDELLKEWEKMNESKTNLYKEYNDLKFGMFIHWGAYSSLGGIWQSKQIPGLGDMLTAGDNQIPTEINSKYKTWETPGTLNNTWGYKSYDNDWKSLNEMMFWIVEIASKGGNYLLNVGPDGNGVIPEASVKILKEIGAWMKINGEAIYGTSRWTTIKEGPTGLEMKSTTYRKEHGFNSVFTSEDFWFTKKDNNIYVISLASPVTNKVSVKSLFNCRQQIKSIKLLGGKGILKWKASGDKVDINLPPVRKTNTPGFVLKVELK